MSIKILFDPETGKLLGGQAVGYDGVDKRIDIIARGNRSERNVEDLAEVEHAYAPPFSSAKDPVNIAGMVAGNVIAGTSEQISWTEVMSPEKKGLFLLDVRTEEEYSLSSIDGALNIPIDDLRRRMAELPTDKKIVVYCGVGFAPMSPNESSDNTTVRMSPTSREGTRPTLFRPASRATRISSPATMSGRMIRSTRPIPDGIRRRRCVPSTPRGCSVRDRSCA